LSLQTQESVAYLNWSRCYTQDTAAFAWQTLTISVGEFEAHVGGVAVKNIVLCFDHTQHRTAASDATNAEALFNLLDGGDPGSQITWYHTGAGPSSRGFGPSALRWREAAVETARAAIGQAYSFLVHQWDPGDRIFLFGVGRGAYCARSLARLLDTVGVQPARHADLLDYVLASYALPRTRRTPQDWRRVTGLASKLASQHDVAVPVEFLGLWDTLKVPGGPRLSTAEPLTNVVTGRHAVAIDGGHGPFGACPGGGDAKQIDEVWFRGAHCDIAGDSRARWPLADITLDWMLDGAVAAGAIARAGSRYETPAPTEVDALADTARTISFRKLPAEAPVHASVELYLRAHPEYWRRLPPRVVWVDADWSARSERLLRTAVTPAAVAHSPEVLAAVAS
jgi:hypothetical protein